MFQKYNSSNSQDELWIFRDVWIILFVHIINRHHYSEGSKKNIISLLIASKRKWDNRWQGLGVDKKPSVSCTTLFCIKRNEIYLETHELQNYRKCIRICQLATHDMSIVLYIHPISTHYLRRERISEMIIRWCWNGMSKVISLIYIRI